MGVFIEDSGVEWAIVNKTFRTDYLVIVNIMTYKGDQEMLEFCLRALLKVLEKNPIEIYIMDDDNNPMDDDYIQKFKDLSPAIRYERTTFERNKNLNGRACIIGMLEKFKEHAAGRDALNLKIDPDTIVCRRMVFDEVYNAYNSAHAATTRPGCHFSGILYMFRTEPLEKAIELAKTFPIPEDRGPEDYIIGLAICAASLPKLSLMISVWSEGEGKGLAAAWNYHITKERFDDMIPQYAGFFHIITMGNWFMFKELSLQDRLEPARRLVEVIESRKEKAENGDV